MTAKSQYPAESGKHRLWLDRIIDLPLFEPQPPLAVIMNNPSTADAARDDPTVRRVAGFARRNSYGRVLIGNLYTHRSTDPARLDTGPGGNHEMADEVLDWILTQSAAVVAAWGVGPSRVRSRQQWRARERQVLSILLSHLRQDQPLYTLGPRPRATTRGTRCTCIPTRRSPGGR